ncbi:MAG: HK97-gp10 family putative phage morphogenesis protein [Lachnospiraceae bacterium]
MAKLDLKFAGMDAYIEALRQMGEDVKQVTDEALQQGVEIINEEMHAEMRKHHVTGETERSIRDGESVKWNGDKASIKYGFNIKKGGEPAIYLEKGRPHQRPTPVVKPAVKRAEKRLQEVQEEALRKVMDRANG